MDCPHGLKYDLLREECNECEFAELCKEDNGKGKSKEPAKSKEEIQAIIEKVASEFSCTEDELSTYRGCMGVVNRVMQEYSKNGLRKTKGWKERKNEVKPLVKDIGRLPVTDEKLDFIIHCAEYVYFGGNA